MTTGIRNSIIRKNCRMNTWAGVVVALAVLTAGIDDYAQPAGDTWSDLQEIVRLTQAHMSDDVIINYIKGSGKAYPKSADALLYLGNQGVSQPVLAALLASTASASPAPAPAPGTSEAPTLDYFQAHLSPYGEWVDVPGVGMSWIPAEANNFGWRPYMDAGHWEFTDAGWFWQSDYPWGDMAFHYGRWTKNEFTGGRWAWVPGYDWAPSWVAWREGAGGMGWAPLPWGVEYHVGLGLYWHGAVVVEGIDFGLGFDSFVFVGNDHFWGGNYNLYVFDLERSRVFFEHSQFHAGYRMEGGHLMAEGLGRDHMAAITHHAVVAHKVVELRHAEESHNLAKRTEQHKELAHVPAPKKAADRSGAGQSPAGASPERTDAHPVSKTGATAHDERYPEASRTPEARDRATGIASERTNGHAGFTSGAAPGTTGHSGTPVGGVKAAARPGTTNSLGSKPPG
jgi:hypothetical protein